MKGQYNGCIMSVTGTILPGASGLARLQLKLSKKAKRLCSDPAGRSYSAGYLSKCIVPQGVASAVRRVFKGEHLIDKLLVRPRVAQRVLKQLQGMEKEGLTKPLSPKEMEILGYFANGYLCKQVAQAMGVNEQQITKDMASIVSKNLPPTGASNTTTAY